MSAKKLANLEMQLDYDIGVCGNSINSKEIVFNLVRNLFNLKPLNIGAIETAGMVESFTQFRSMLQQGVK